MTMICQICISFVRPIKLLGQQLQVLRQLAQACSEIESVSSMHPRLLQLDQLKPARGKPPVCETFQDLVCSTCSSRYTEASKINIPESSRKEPIYLHRESGAGCQSISKSSPRNPIYEAPTDQEQTIKNPLRPAGSMTLSFRSLKQALIFWGLTIKDTLKQVKVQREWYCP